MSNLRIYRDTNSNGSYDAGTDTLITYLDQVAADANASVFVVADVPLGRSTNDVAGVRLTGTASEATAAGSLGATVTQTAGANTAGVDTVFADTNAGRQYGARRHPLRRGRLYRPRRDPDRDQDQPRDQRSAERHDQPEDDPGRGRRILHRRRQRGGQRDRDQRRDLGYAAGGRRPTMPTFGVLVNGTVTGGTCNADGAIAGSHAAGVVSGTIPSLAAGDTRTVLFRVTIN